MWISRFIAAHDVDLPIQSTLHMDVGVQILRDVFMGRRQQESGARAISQSANVKGDNPGQRAIQRCCKLVCDEPLRSLRQPECEAKAIALPVGEFRWSSQHEVSLTQPAGRQQLHALIDRERETVDQNPLAQLEVIDVEDRVEG